MKTQVYVSNLSEDVWEFITSLSTPTKKYEVNENAFLSDRDIFCLDPKKRSILIVPIALDPAFLKYYQGLLHNQLVEIWVPAKHSGEICHDIQADPQLWKKLLQLSKSETIELKSYSASREFFALLKALREKGAKVETSESPVPENAWVVDFFGSKTGIRQLVQQIQANARKRSTWMSPGYISSNCANTAAMAADFYIKHNGVVIKTNKAHSGAGVMIVHPNQLPHEYFACSSYFLELFAKEKYWQQFPSVVEEYLHADTSMGGGNPNGEFLITPDGKVKFLYSCGLRVTKEGVFKGIEIGPNIFPKAILNRILVFGKEIGKALSQSGYRGYFDIDCVYTKTGKLFLAESNVRRTGGTHVYHAAHQLLGRNSQKHAFILSNNTYALPAEKTFTFSQTQDSLEPLLFSRKKKEGVILVAANILKQNKLSYIVIGKDKKSALAIETKMEKLLEQFGHQK